MHKRSKHCRVCNKCIGNFDHHCKWLNNCIGSANYKIFFALICDASLLTGLHFGLNAYLVQRAWVEEEFFDLVGRGFAFEGSSRTSLLAFLVVSNVVAGAVFLLLVHLVLFHIYLGYEGISTYDYILRQRAQKQEKKEAKDARQQGVSLREAKVDVGDSQNSAEDGGNSDTQRNYSSHTWVVADDGVASSRRNDTSSDVPKGVGQGACFDLSFQTFWSRRYRPAPCIRMFPSAPILAWMERASHSCCYVPIQSFLEMV